MTSRVITASVSLPTGPGGTVSTPATLERSLKAYIKMVVCYPERVTRADYDSILKEFHHSEKVRIFNGVPLEWF